MDQATEMDQTTDPQPEQVRPGLPRRRRSAVPVKPRRKGAETPDEEALTLARRIVDLASDKKASDIVLLEVGS